MPRSFLALVLVALALLVGVPRLLRSLAPPRERIERRLAEMAEGFDESRTAHVLEGFAAGYRDEGSGLERADLHRILVHLFFQEIDPATKRFRMRVELAQTEVTLAPDGERADVRVHARFFARDHGTEEIFWDARVEGEMRDGPDGWQFVRTHDVNHGERRPHR